MANIASNLNFFEDPNGRVSVKLQRNYFSKDSSDKFVGSAVRNTRTVGNVLQLVADKVPQLDIGMKVLFALGKTLKVVLSERTKAAIGKLAVSQEDYSPVSETISKITDIDTGRSGDALSLNGSVQIFGKRLLIGGYGSGICLAPASGENDAN